MKSAYGWRVIFHGYVVTVEEAQEVRDYVSRTTREQSKSYGLTDPAQIEKVLVLLGYSREATA
jgi:hypothetical protein